MIPRFFCSQPMQVGATVDLPLEVAHHALRVLRLRQGAAIVLFDGTGGGQTNQSQNEFWVGSTIDTGAHLVLSNTCLLYTSDAADE